MYHRYYKDWEVKPEYKKEFVSLWPGRLGQENMHKLDEVRETEWQRFNHLLIELSRNYSLQQAIHSKRKLKAVESISSVLSSYPESMSKDASQFSSFVISELDCIFSEEWDYTYIIWYMDESVITELSPIIQKAGLYHFS